MNLNGLGSWFGGPRDSTDSGHTASGGTTAEPGIAVYNHGTLGGYWRVTAPNGRTVVVRQTDIGPAPWTGRKIDVTYSALNKFGYNEGNFPTSQGEFKATYLGKNQPKGGEAQATAAQALPQALPRVPTAQTQQVQGFDQAGFQKAQRASILGRLISEGGERKNNPLFAAGLVTTKAPLRSEFTTQTTQPAAAKPEAATAAAPLPGVPRAAGPGGKLGGFLPGNAELQWKRIDQGQDIQTNPGGPIIAPGDGVVVAVKSDPSGFGPDYPVVKFTSGPMAGTSWYLGHTHSALKPGDSFHAGQTLSHTGSGGRVGNATVPGWAEIGLSSALGSGNMQAGRATERYLKGGRR